MGLLENLCDDLLQSIALHCSQPSDIFALRGVCKSLWRSGPLNKDKGTVYKMLCAKYEWPVQLAEGGDENGFASFKHFYTYWGMLEDGQMFLNQSVDPLIIDNAYLVRASTQTDVLAFVSHRLRKDRELVLELTRRSGEHLQFADASFAHDYDIVASAVATSGQSLQHAASQLRDDETIVIPAVRENGSALRFASARLRAHLHTVHCAVEKDGNSLAFASASLQDNDLVVMAAVSSNGMSIFHASPRLRDSERIAMSALTSNPQCLVYLSSRLKDSLTIVQTAVEHDIESIKYASSRVRGMRDVARPLLRKCGALLVHLEPTLQDDFYTVLEAVKNDGMALVYASASLRDHEYVVRVALEQNVMAYQFASHRLRRDVSIILRILYASSYDGHCPIPTHIRKEIMHLRECVRDTTVDDEAHSTIRTGHGSVLGRAMQSLQQLCGRR